MVALMFLADIGRGLKGEMGDLMGLGATTKG